jgi:glutamate dehydrogenase/leucine dehydrogenase
LLVEKLKTVDAFVVFDLDDADCSAGVVRCAPKILVDGATWLARSSTYQLASFELRAGGASAGVNAPVEQRHDALAAFVAEVQPWVAARRIVVDPAKGVRPDDLAPLRAGDPRPPEIWDDSGVLAAASIVAATEAAVGDLDGRTFGIEGFDGAGPSLATELAVRGARVVALATAAGTASAADGFDADVLVEQWRARGPDLVRELEPEPAPPASVLGAEVDVLVCGSKAGVIDHGVAAGCSARVVVPSGPIPVTAKGLAVLKRAGVCVLPDFVTTAGPMLAGLAPVLDGDRSTALSDIRARVAAVVREVLDDEQGPVLGACRRAEAFLRTWQAELPFGRPLA